MAREKTFTVPRGEKMEGKKIKNPITHRGGKNNPKDRRFLIRNYKGQEKVA